MTERERIIESIAPPRTPFDYCHEFITVKMLLDGKFTIKEYAETVGLSAYTMGQYLKKHKNDVIEYMDEQRKQEGEKIDE